ncbi:MAG: hypothetical protein GKR99_12510 [Rhodobacteraceae bacterium]|nr:hypothetical protein [Paracoccaceae bacterium]
MNTPGWIAANAAGLAIANASVPAIFRLTWQAGAADTMIAIWVGLWWALRPRRGLLWVLATMLVLALGWLWTVTLRSTDILGTATLLSQARDAAIFGAAIGAAIGVLQWPGAKPNAPDWILRSTLGWILAMVALNLGEALVGPTEGTAHIAMRLGLGAIGGAMLGAVTAVLRG